MQRTLFVRGRSGPFSVEILDRSRSNYWIIGLAAGNDFHGPLRQALPVPSHVSLARPVLSCTHFFQASSPATQASYQGACYHYYVKQVK